MTRIRRGAVSVALAAIATLLTTGTAAVTPQRPEPPAPVHVQNRDYTPRRTDRLSRQGERLYAQRQCANCHQIAGKGGLAGPPLDGVGARRSESFLTAKITDPKRFAEENPEQNAWEPSWMAHPRANRGEIRAIVAYLLTLPEPLGGFSIASHGHQREDPSWQPPSVWTPLPESELSRKGRHLFYNVGCAACHAIGRFGGEFGPRLDGIGERHSRVFIVWHVSNPEMHAAENPRAFPYGTMMPAHPLSGDDIDAIVEYLLTLPDAGE